MKVIKTLFINAMLVIMSILLTFSVAEILYRYFVPDSNAIELEQEKLLEHYENDFIEKVSELDRQAIHGNRCTYPSTKKDPNTFRIIMLGDSMTHGTGLKCLYTYPRKLEVLLNKNSDDKNYEVINLAYPGFDTADANELYQNYRNIEHDAVIIGVYFNDVHLNSSKIIKTAEEHRLYLEKIKKKNELKSKFNYSRIIQRLIDFHTVEDSDLNNSRGLEFFSTHIKKLTQSIKTNGSEAKVIVLPQIEMPNDGPFEELINSVINIIESNDVEVMDLSKVFLEYDPLFFRHSYRDIHWSRSGHNIIAKELLNIILKKNFFSFKRKNNADDIHRVLDARQKDHYQVVPVEKNSINNFLVEYKNNGFRNEARYAYFDGFGNAINSKKIMIGSLMEQRPIFRPDWDPITGYMPQVFYKTRSKYLEDSYENNVTLGQTATSVYCMENGECELKYKVDSLSKVIEGQIQIMARMYQIGGILEAFISEDGKNYNSIYKIKHQGKGWTNYEEIVDLTEHIKNKTIFYLKFAFKDHPKNDWVSLNQWGISLKITPDIKKMGIPSLNFNDVYRFSGSKRLLKKTLEAKGVHENLKIRGKIW